MALYGLRIPPAPKYNGSETADTSATIALIPQTDTIKRDGTESEPKSEEGMRVLLFGFIPITRFCRVKHGRRLSPRDWIIQKVMAYDISKGQRKSYKHSTEAQHNPDVFELEASTFRGPTRAINETPTTIEEFMDNSRYSVARISRASGRRWETPNTIDAYIDNARRTNPSRWETPNTIEGYVDNARRIGSYEFRGDRIVYSYQAPVPASGDPQGFAFRIRTLPIMEIPPVKESPPVTESPSVTRSILAMERIPVTAKFYLGRAV